MKNITKSLPLRVATLCGDLQFLSDGELADTLLGLHQDIAASHRFGRVAGRAVHDHCVKRLADVGAELQRRAALHLDRPASLRIPDPLIAPPPASQPAAAA